MGSTRRQRLVRLLNRFRSGHSSVAAESTIEPDIGSVEYTNPVDAYYRHKAKTNLRVLYRFGIQSRSLQIRDVFAKASSDRNLPLSDLLISIAGVSLQDLSTTEKRSLSLSFDSSILLALADLLANTARGDFDTIAAVEIYKFVYCLYGKESFTTNQKLLYVEALSDAGQHEQAWDLAGQFAVNDLAPLQQELLYLQRVRQSAVDVSDWVDTFNVIAEEIGLTKLRLLPDENKPALDRLAAASLAPVNGPKVSVIVPTYCPGPGIHTAIRGLLEQTWQNLEIVIVDDASPPEFRNVFTELSELDSRIRVLHQETNAGAYVARNTGLAAATGDYITTADDDDWSHPDKIASQASILEENSSLIATTSAHIRTTENLELRRLNSSPKFLQMNYSSLMFRREVIEEIGGWDTVNRGADSEFYSRLKEYYGKNSILSLTNRPLALSRVRRGSLTDGEMYRGFISTPRVLYLWAIRQWRWDLGKINKKPVIHKDEPRPYAIPSNFESGQRHRNYGRFDVVYAADFFRQAKHIDLILNELETLSESGLRVGYMHLYSPETNRPEGFPKRLFELQLKNRITQLSLEDTAETDLLLVQGTATGMFLDQVRSCLQSRRGIVIDRPQPELAGAENRIPSIFPQALRNLDRAFNAAFEIIRVPAQAPESLVGFVPDNRNIGDQQGWGPHVRRISGQIRLPSSKPVVGFHSYGNRYRYPGSAKDFSDIYLSDAFSTRIFGQQKLLRKKFGNGLIEKLDLIDPSEMSEQDFLDGIDFWVYFPNDRLVDCLWEPVLKAMSAGKVVILPHRLEDIYGSAAVYAEKHQVSAKIQELSAQSDAYRLQAEEGLTFVTQRFSSTAFLARIGTLLPD